MLLVVQILPTALRREVIVNEFVEINEECAAWRMPLSEPYAMLRRFASVTGGEGDWTHGNYQPGRRFASAVPAKMDLEIDDITPLLCRH